MSLAIEVQLAEGFPGLPTRDDWQQWVERALHHSGRTAAELCIRIVGKPESAELNQRYRQRSGPTNVLSFPCESVQAEPQPLGDLVLCAPLIASEAQEQGKALHDHWAHLCIHGVLHLLGHDHQTPVQTECMESLERDILGELGIADPYL